MQLDSCVLYYYILFNKKTKMNGHAKDTVEVLAANGGALGLTLTQCNEILQFVSLGLAISYTLYKFWKLTKK